MLLRACGPGQKRTGSGTGRWLFLNFFCMVLYTLVEGVFLLALRMGRVLCLAYNSPFPFLLVGQVFLDFSACRGTIPHACVLRAMANARLLRDTLEATTLFQPFSETTFCIRVLLVCEMGSRGLSISVCARLVSLSWSLYSLFSFQLCNLLLWTVDFFKDGRERNM
jgi:hypothetical protein